MRSWEITIWILIAFRQNDLAGLLRRQRIDSDDAKKVREEKIMTVLFLFQPVHRADHLEARILFDDLYAELVQRTLRVFLGLMHGGAGNAQLTGSLRPVDPCGLAVFFGEGGQILIGVKSLVLHDSLFKPHNGII